jgi:Fe-S-cluster containining protein
MIEASKIKEISQEYAKQNTKFRRFLKFNTNNDTLHAQFAELHNELFSVYDCCKCANCCKLYLIYLENEDVIVISKYLRQSQNDFIDTYLTEAEDDGEKVYQIKESPCSFLEPDGKCRIQECKPLVCRDFPYTDKPGKLKSLLELLNFAEECPVVFEIIERLKKMYNFQSR